MSRYCVDCDEHFEPSQRICPNCGYSLTNLDEIQQNPPGSHQTQSQQRREDYYFGISSILLGFIGLLGFEILFALLTALEFNWNNSTFIIWMSTILPSFGIVLGGRGLVKDKTNFLSIAGLIISILVFPIVFFHSYGLMIY